jgi:hypothetical protein
MRLPFPVAAERTELADFLPAGAGLVQRPKMKPAGRMHAACGERTLCGLRLDGMHVFPTLQFGAGRWDRYCQECRTVACRRAALLDLRRGHTP